MTAQPNNSQMLKKPIIDSKTNNKNPYKLVGEFLLDLLQTFIIAIGLFVIIYNFLAQPNSVIGSSMEPNFYDGEYILTDKITYRLRNPQRGEVVVFNFPRDVSKDYIKRIIALPGESVLIENNQIVIFSDEYSEGLVLSEVYLDEDTITSGGTIFPEGEKTVVPHETYLVMGDNRSSSSDSRSWGTVDIDEIVGKVIFRYWPFNQLGITPKIDYST